MFLCEALLLTLMTLLGIYASYTDLRHGIVENRAIIVASTVGIVINVPYLCFFCRDFWQVYVVNLLIMSSVSVTMYLFHFWAAGDSKLLICVSILFPARLYQKVMPSIAPGIYAFICIFLIAYFYIVIDTVIQMLGKQRSIHDPIMLKKHLISFAINYVRGFIYVRALNEIFRNITGELYYENQVLFSFACIFFAIIVYDKRIFKKWYIIALAIVVNAIFWKDFLTFAPRLFSYVILLIAMLLRYFLSGYNYQEIETDKVAKGMVLSRVTVLYFVASRIKGLPQVTYEDMRSRLTEEEAEAVRRWGKSKNGKELVTIVRKIPFAVFIVLGELMFFVFALRG